MGAVMQPFFFSTRGTDDIDRMKIIELQDEGHALRAALRAWKRFGPGAARPPARGEIRRLEVRDGNGTPICIFQYKSPPERQ